MGSDEEAATPLGPRTIELVGPPGAGKSTLRAALCADAGRAVPVSIYWRPGHTGAFLRSALSLAPLCVVRVGREAFDLRRASWIVRLGAAPAILRRVSAGGARVAVFEQGPVYTMVRLRAAIPEDARMPRFARWWDDVVRAWARSLDLVVLLDAPDDVLIDRIRGRSKAHVLKAERPETARRFLGRERDLYERVVGELGRHRPVPVLRADTSLESAERIAGRLLAAPTPTPTPTA